jgi:hypothetical protein
MNLENYDILIGLYLEQPRIETISLTNKERKRERKQERQEKEMSILFPRIYLLFNDAVSTPDYTGRRTTA